MISQRPKKSFFQNFPSNIPFKSYNLSFSIEITREIIANSTCEDPCELISGMTSFLSVVKE